MSWHQQSSLEVAKAVKNREVSAQEVVAEFLKRIRDLNPKLQVFLKVEEEHALQAAQALDQRLAAGKTTGPLAGVPVALKDNLCTRGIETTCGSKILAGWKPPYEATVVERLKAADAIVIGKANMDEFAMGSSCENSAFFPTRNPWNPECVPGGSSGGSAAAVAAGLASLALGSDTGGSIRQPASFCGVVGMKPTYGRVSRFGLVAFASSLDQIGPFARTAEEAALLLGVIAGHDPKDATSAEVLVPDYLKNLRQDIRGLRIGLPREYFGAGIDPDVKQAIEAAKAVYQDMGAQLLEVWLPHTDYCLATYYVVATAEASSNLARYDGVQYGLRCEADNLISMYRATRAQGFGPEVKRRIMLGTYVLSAGYYDAYYKKALQVRTLIQRDFLQAFEKCDVILTPTAPSGAFRLGAKTDDPLAMYLSDIYTTSAPLSGLPAISVPCGFTREHLPIGLQLIGRAFEEERLLQAACQYQNHTNWHQIQPNL